ncbi:hypothetical protein CRUP_008591 [Coryphaenoides rupestris]|nr:hypothetical protein CRUP_008591 [Coryphaenoides rupestris]
MVFSRTSEEAQEEEEEEEESKADQKGPRRKALADDILTPNTPMGLRDGIRFRLNSRLLFS